MLTKDEIKARIDLAALIQDSGVQVHKNGQEWIGRCPFHDDSKASLSVNPDKRLWQCFGCGKSGDCFAWIMELRKVDFKTALAELRQRCGDASTANTSVWNITDVDGNLIAQHFRYDHPDGTKTYSWNGQDGLGGIKAGELPLYGIKHLFDMETAAVNSIIITEGEKATDALIKAGFAAVGTVTGASSCPNQEVFAPLIGFEARKYVWPDNDDAGRRHMDKVAHHLKAIDIQPYLIQWPDAQPKGDAFDYVQQGGNVQTLLDTAVPWEPVREVTPLLERNNVITSYRGTLQQPESPNNRYRNVTDSPCNGGVPAAVTLQSEEGLPQRILDWVKSTTTWWSTQDLDNELVLKDTQAKNYRRVILHRLKEQGIIEPHLTVDKQWRYVNKKITALDFKSANRSSVLQVKWPFGVERFVNLHPGNIVVVAGSPDAGKTALLLNFIRMNMNHFPIYYFCSEMGQDELHDRLELFPGISVDDWPFEAVDRASDFQDVVVPDCINIIDFMEISKDFYGVNEALTKIRQKIGTGLAIVALQKKVGAELGRGAEFSLEKPRLYLSMDRGKLTIIKGKSWAQPGVNPHGLTVYFKITDGCEFQVTSDWTPRT